jgi:hypothetical protein
MKLKKSNLLTDWPDICTLRTSARKKRKRSQVRASAQHRLKKGTIQPLNEGNSKKRR